MKTQDHPSNISNFVKFNRARLQLTQPALAEKAGVGLRFIRDIEQGKTSLRMDKVNQVLSLFGHSLTPTSEKIVDPYHVNLKFLNRPATIFLKNKTVLSGLIIEQITQQNQITGWKFIPNEQIKAFKKDADSKRIINIPLLDIDRIEINSRK